MSTVARSFYAVPDNISVKYVARSTDLADVTDAKRITRHVLLRNAQKNHNRLRIVLSGSECFSIGIGEGGFGVDKVERVSSNSFYVELAKDATLSIVVGFLPVCGASPNVQATLLVFDALEDKSGSEILSVPFSASCLEEAAAAATVDQLRPQLPGARYVTITSHVGPTEQATITPGDVPVSMVEAVFSSDGSTGNSDQNINAPGDVVIVTEEVTQSTNAAVLTSDDELAFYRQFIALQCRDDNVKSATVLPTAGACAANDVKEAKSVRTSKAHDVDLSRGVSSCAREACLSSGHDDGDEAAGDIGRSAEPQASHYAGEPNAMLQAARQAVDEETRFYLEFIAHDMARKRMQAEADKKRDVDARRLVDGQQSSAKFFVDGQWVDARGRPVDASSSAEEQVAVGCPVRQGAEMDSFACEYILGGSARGRSEIANVRVRGCSKATKALAQREYERRLDASSRGRPTKVCAAQVKVSQPAHQRNWDMLQ